MSIKKIQEMTGFSHSTISRVLNGKAQEFRISDKTCGAILAAAAKIKYRPSILARSLRLKKTMTIGLIVPDIKNPFFGELAWRIEILLREQGYSTIICNTDGIADNETSYLNTLADREVDGILIAPIHTEEWSDLEEVRRKKAVVLVVRALYQTDLPWVTSDNARAAEELASELIEQGMTRIAFLGGKEGTYINSARFQGYRNALRAHRLPFSKKLVMHRDFTIESGEEMMQALLERIPDLQAIFCINNLVFLGAMRVITRSAKEALDHIMVASFDIARHSDLFRRPLISANQDMKSIAESSVSLLLDEITHNRRPEPRITIPVQIEKYRF